MLDSPQASRTARGAAELKLGDAAVELLRSRLREIAGLTVTAIIVEVPAYTNALAGPMGPKIEGAVQLALGGFLKLASSGDPGTPLAPALEGAYVLGRGEARSGRAMDALLAAYRVGARVSWRELSRTAVAAGLSADTLARFAELVFAYIDELSAASVSGHTDELATTGRVRERYLQDLGRGLLQGDPADQLAGRAELADWDPPRTLTAVILPSAHVRTMLGALDPRTLRVEDDQPELAAYTDEDASELAVLLVPDADTSRRPALLRSLRGYQACVGPPQPWTTVRTSYLRALRARQLRLPPTPTATGTRPSAGGGTSALRTGRSAVGSGSGALSGAGRSAVGTASGASALGTGGGTGALDAADDPDAPVDTERHLTTFVVTSDPAALDDLRRQVLAPFASLRPATADRLTETLREWLLHLGRRDEVAAALHIHPQTVRYRMGQIRDLYGPHLDDPQTVLDLTIALATPPHPRHFGG